MKNQVIAMIVAVIALIFTGCTHVYESTAISQSETNSNGIAYALPTSWLEISAARIDGGTEIGVRSKTLPDAGHIYSLDHSSSAFASDELTITVGTNQLLSSVNTKTHDQWDEFIVALTKSAAGVSSFSVPDRGRSDPLKESECQSPPEAPWKIFIDPFNNETWPDWLDKDCLKLLPITGRVEPTSSLLRANESCETGICHRTPIYYRIELDFGSAGQHQIIEGLLTQSPILSVDVERALFVEKTVNLTFSDGVLTSVNIKQPSSAVSVASLPLDVAKAIFSAPTELLQFRVDYSNRVAEDLKAEMAMVQQQHDFESKRLNSSRTDD